MRTLTIAVVTLLTLAVTAGADELNWAPVAEDSSLAAETEQPGWVSTKTLVKLDRADVNVVRLGPGESFALLEIAPRDAEYPVLTKRGDWYNVRLSGSRTGWIHETLCTERHDLSGLEFRPNPRMYSRVGMFSLTGWGGGYSFDQKSNSVALGGRLGYYLFDWLEFEGGVGWTHVNRPAEIVESLFDIRLEAEEFHMLFYEMNGNVEILPGRQLVPYITAGVGSSIMRGETEPAWNVGGGIRFFVAQRVATRWEFRNYRFESGDEGARRSNSNFVFALGTTVIL
jgi:outer membrane beta-barrel protein